MQVMFRHPEWELWRLDNWDEFLLKARQGNLDLDINSAVYPEISENIFPRAGILVFSYKAYRRRLIQKMIANQKIFRKVIGTGGVDFCYYPKSMIHDFRPWYVRFVSWIFD